RDQRLAVRVFDNAGDDAAFNHRQGHRVTGMIVSRTTQQRIAYVTHCTSRQEIKARFEGIGPERTVAINARTSLRNPLRPAHPRNYDVSITDWRAVGGYYAAGDNRRGCLVARGHLRAQRGCLNQESPDECRA